MFTNTFWRERSVQTGERRAFVHENDSLRKNRLFLCLVQVHPSVCSHFRGGTFIYKPVDQSNPANTTVSFRDQTMQRICTMSTIHWNFCVLFTRLIFIVFVYVYFSVYPLDLHHVLNKRGNVAERGFYWFAKRLSLRDRISWNVQVNVHKMHPVSVHKLQLTHSFSSRSFI